MQREENQGREAGVAGAQSKKRLWLVQSVIRRLPNSSHVEESMAGHEGVKGVY
jgi:hypothetical protein